MQFRGPEAADLIDVRSLNVAFLEYLSGSLGEQLRQDLPVSLRSVVAAMSERQIHRLADVPFLLLTLSESDDAYWTRLLADSPVRDLFATGRGETDPLARIAAATLAFLWHLARRNAYATRLISGASLQWCEQLASCTLISVLQCAVAHQGLVGARLAESEVFWRRLLGAGLSSESDVRHATHLVSLQTVLTPVAATHSQRFRSAACYSLVPVLELQGERQTDGDN